MRCTYFTLRIRCDRLVPCSNCSSRGSGATCTYPQINNATPINPKQTAAPLLPKTTTSQPQLQDRIDQLENLVLNLLRQTQQPIVSVVSPLEENSSPLQGGLAPSSRSRTEPVHTIIVNSEAQREVPPSPSDYGSIRIEGTGATYVSSSHWAAILESIADLRSQFANEGDAQLQPQAKYPKPQLFYYSPVFETKVSIINSIPPRSVVDRLISRYFNVLDIATGQLKLS